MDKQELIAALRKLGMGHPAGAQEVADLLVPEPLTPAEVYEVPVDAAGNPDWDIIAKLKDTQPGAVIEGLIVEATAAGTKRTRKAKAD